MEKVPERKRTLMPLRRRKPLPEPVAEVKRTPDHYYFQVHFQPVPGARKNHFDAIRPTLLERTHEMIRRGQLLFAGGYPSSIGGMWLLKVKTRSEAERLVLDHPAVACSLLTHKLIELQEPEGAIVSAERLQAVVSESSESEPQNG